MNQQKTIIKEVLDALSQEDRKQLMYAFENEFAQYIELGNSKFVGVNVEPLTNLRILEAAGVWSYGTITS